MNDKIIPERKRGRVETLIENFVFSTKWMLLPFYFGLVIALGVYAVHFIYQVYAMVREFGIKDSNSIMMTVLELVDITMVANLIKMIITGSYTSFVNKLHQYPWEKSSSGMLKVKMSTSLVGVTAIHLLQTFLSANTVDWDTIKKQLCIHLFFLLGSLILMVIELLHEKAELLRTKHERRESNTIKNEEHS